MSELPGVVSALGSEREGLGSIFELAQVWCGLRGFGCG